MSDEQLRTIVFHHGDRVLRVGYSPSAFWRIVPTMKRGRLRGRANFLAIVKTINGRPLSELMLKAIDNERLFGPIGRAVGTDAMTNDRGPGKAG